MKGHLRGSGDFQKVYRSGKRYDGHLLTAFVLPNSQDQHRLGVTASKKAIGNAVNRNRAKRLLRETFRSTGSQLEGLRERYDWVLNARRAILSPEALKRLEEFERIIAAVAREERTSSKVETQLV